MANQFSARAGDALRWWAQHKFSLAISFAVTLLALTVYIATFVGERPTPIFDFVNRLELASLDTRFRLRSKAHPDPRLVLVDIDQRSQEVLGRWPFPRIVFARLLDNLREDGARVVAFDITFSEPDRTAQPLAQLRIELEAERKRGEPVSASLLAEIARREKEYDYDKRFGEAIERFGKVVLGNFFLYTEADLRGVTPDTLDRYANLLARFPYPQVRPTAAAHGHKSYLRLLQNYDDLRLLPRGAEANTEELTTALVDAKGATGFFNVFTDADGVVRRSVLALPYGRDPDRGNWDLYASIDVQAVRMYLNLPEDQTVLDFGPEGVAGLEFGPQLVIHPDDVSRLMINFQGPVRTYPYVSIADAVKGTFPPGAFRDKIVVVGASATGIGDLRVTPYGSLDYPGVEIHANIIDNILNQKFLQRGASQVGVDLAMIGLFGIPLGVVLAIAQPRWMALALVLLVPFAAVVYAAFQEGWWLNFTIPLATLVANTGLVALYRVLIEEREKRRVRGAFQHYLSPEVIRRLLENPQLVEPRKTEVSVMFSDVRGFTTISEQLDAQELAALLNGYLTEMTRIVFDNHGTLDKYIGDAVMAIWGAPYEEPGHAGKSCHAALDMMRKLPELQEKWKASGRPVLDIGIGINTGPASVGNMGSALRYGYTAMGDAVNLAARLEGLNKEYSTHILVSETTHASAAGQEFLFRELDLIRVKGKKKPVTIYELLGYRDGAAEFDGLVELFTEGRNLYMQRDWEQARYLFEKILERWPDDGPARIFLSRCFEFIIEGPDPEWDGVYTMKYK
jgi:adenylate cyclase